MDKMVGKIKFIYKRKYIDQSILVGKIYWSKYLQTSNFINITPSSAMTRNALESDTIFKLHITYNSNNGHICMYFSCPIYSIYKLVGWKLVEKIKLILFKAFYLILIEYTINFNKTKY